MADQKGFKLRLKKLMSRSENAVCADCPERSPRWASLIVPPPGSQSGSLPIGAFACLECSGSHRRLGVHISFVRSITLDSWTEKHVLSMENGGNKKVNDIFEAKLNARKPAIGASGNVRERFIRDKYERRRFYDPNVMAKYNTQESSDDESDDSDEDEEPVTKQRKPSEAALRRRQQQQKVRSTKPAVRKPKPKLSAAAPAPQPEVDLLGFDAFDSNPSPSPIAPAPTPAATAPAPAPTPSTCFGDFSAFAAPMPGATQAPETEPKKSATIDIMAMYSAGAPMAPMPMVGASGGMMPNGMPNAGMAGMMNNNNPMMMGATKQAPTGNNNMVGMMQQMQLNNNSNSNSLPPQQQQMMNMMKMQQQQQQMQQQMQMNPQAALMYQQQQQMQQQMQMNPQAARMYQQQQQMMMQQKMMMNQNQQVQPGMNNMMMNNNNNVGGYNAGGVPMGVGSSMMQHQQPTKKSEPEKNDPFAQFSAF